MGKPKGQIRSIRFERDSSVSPQMVVWFGGQDLRGTFLIWLQKELGFKSPNQLQTKELGFKSPNKLQATNAGVPEEVA